MTQAALAERVGLSVAWVRVLEAAPVLGAPATLARVAAALGVEPSALFGTAVAGRSTFRPIGIARRGPVG